MSDAPTIEEPVAPTEVEVKKTYIQIAGVVATVRKNWKTVTGVITVLGALSGGVTHYVSSVSATRAEVVSLRKEVEDLRDEVKVGKMTVEFLSKQVDDMGMYNKYRTPNNRGN